MSISDKNLSESIWEWNDPRLPLARIRRAWLSGESLSEEQLAVVVHNREHNPDIRIREECRALLSAADANDVSSAPLRRKANAGRLRAMIIHINAPQRKS